MVLTGVTAISLFSCNEEFDRPPIVLPEAEHDANITITDLKTEHWKDAKNYADLIGDKTPGEHTYIKGRVISSDETGNIYKSLVIQGEDGGALAFSVNDNKLYETFRIGQEIVVDLTGLYLGKYNGLMQVGEKGEYQGSDEVTFMDKEEFIKHVEMNGLPQPSKVKTKKMTIPEIIEAKNSSEGLCANQSQLIELEGVYFVDGGKARYSEPDASTNRTISDADGNKLIVRNSNYATFASETLPYGKGKIRAILSFYGSDWQLLIRDSSDCYDFDGENPNPPIPVEPTTLLIEDFESYTKYDEVSALKGWNSVVVHGNKNWYVNEFDNNKYIACTAYKGTDKDGYEAWLITPPIDFKNIEEPYMSFSAQELYSGDSSLEVYIIDSNDPTTATKKVSLPQFAIGTSTFISTDNIDLEALFSRAGTSIDVGYVAFCYKSSTQAQSKTFGIDNLVVGRQVNPDDPTPSDTHLYEPVTLNNFEYGAKYVIVSQGKYAATPLPNNKTYGYLGATAVTIDGSGHVTAPENVEFILEDASGSQPFNFPRVYIKDASLNRYLYLKGTYDSFNVDTSIQNEGCVWELLIDATSASIRIVNVDKQKAVAYSSSHSSFGAYESLSDDHIVSTLYKRMK